MAYAKSASPLAGTGSRISRVSLSQLALRGPQITAMVDTSHTASPQRIKLWPKIAAPDDEYLAMGTMIRASDGGSLRTFYGNLHHENGWQYLTKARRLLHWEGETAHLFLISAEVHPQITKIGSESVAFELLINGVLETYTADVELEFDDGTIMLVEIKRTERDIEDPDYKLKLAHVYEICRRCGIVFKIVFQDEIYKNLYHRRNSSLFAARGTATILPEHRGRLAKHRKAHGSVTTYHALADALEPGHPVAGKALIQGLLVRRELRMDLTKRLTDLSPVHLN